MIRHLEIYREHFDFKEKRKPLPLLKLKKSSKLLDLSAHRSNESIPKVPKALSTKKKFFSYKVNDYSILTKSVSRSPLHQQTGILKASTFS